MIKNNKLVPRTLKKMKRDFVTNYYNFQGMNFEKKYIIIESDDWGGIRTSSKEAFQSLVKQGSIKEDDPFNRYDALASEEDLELLLDVLAHYKDGRGNHPVITANCAMANPDFKKIKESDFYTFHFEPFTETLSRYPNHKNSFNLWKDGMERGLFYPQLHCREHINIAAWMEDLHRREESLQHAFSWGMIGDIPTSSKNVFGYMNAFQHKEIPQIEEKSRIIEDAVSIFKKSFGYLPDSFTPPCHVWDEELENILKNNGIFFIQGSHYQLIPFKRDQDKYHRIRHNIGEKNKKNQIYLVRNCSFEPSLGKARDSLDICLAQIENSFRWKKPATINTHRLNYIGFIEESNRDPNLRLLDRLLKEITRKWPDAEFITSVELGKKIMENWIKNGNEVMGNVFE